MSAPSETGFDIRSIPFSRRGSWLDISPVVALHDVRDDLHLVSHQTGMHAIFTLEPLQGGERVPVDVDAAPGRLRLAGAGGEIEIVFENDTTLRLRGRMLDLRLADAAAALTPFTGTYLFHDPIDGSAVFTSYETGRRYRITTLRGTATVAGAELLGSGERAVTIGGDEWEVAIEEFETARAPFTGTLSFDEAARAVALDFDDYVDRVAPWRSERTPGAVAAAYVLWSATVSARGFLTREAILMSKHWMDKVWSWDHCFNALALSPGLPREAIDQFSVVFDFQDAAGALPDSVTHSEVLYNFVKPPIHGWAFRKLRQSLAEPLSRDVVAELYGSLVRWTRFWLDSRRAPGHPLAHYQHGNDSGWDNSTTFDNDRLIESPDLAAFLVVQFDVLAELADELGLAGDADEWRAELRSMRGALLELWDADTFVARAVTTGRRSTTTSLLTTLPIVAAAHLPAEVSHLLAERISLHLTEFGPATQLVDTPEYEADGYWRGPIWAPSTALVEDGLRQAGETGLADLISARFRALCERSGFAENFDALTGEGLRDRAYTWTASCYLTLAREAEERRG
ncbi:glycogen debranching protein [Subtercola sp. Z020]|uniref:amylo-alpha-1,6-glucosidase n=1 Tax=Subtercola sp. Z020 TaxID=2080582 RepID=UPI000CE883ED|nr:glycogen debranching protein [Subtercola sp. Z020]PPF89554.1 glycogen debranching protein [Subtercola sp. Z020]